MITRKRKGMKEGREEKRTNREEEREGKRDRWRELKKAGKNTRSHLNLFARLL